MQNIKKDFCHIKTNIDLLVKNLIKKEDIKNNEDNNNKDKNEMIQESFSDVYNNLNNEKNPFLKEQNKENLSHSSISLNNQKKEVNILN